VFVRPVIDYVTYVLSNFENLIRLRPVWNDPRVQTAALQIVQFECLSANACIVAQPVVMPSVICYCPI